jgi:hypothetical protein
MNQFIKAQCRNMDSCLSAFKQSCRAGALQDDGVASKEEELILKRLEKACEKFRSEINKVME